MKKHIKYIVLLIVICFIIIALEHIMKENTFRETVNFKFPNFIEDEILNRVNSSNDYEFLTLSDLIESGDWIKRKVPENHIEFQELGNISWHVKKNESIKVSRYFSESVEGFHYTYYKSDDGFFLNVYKGGDGRLYFYPNGNKDKKYVVEEASLSHIYKIDNSIYAMQSYFGPKGTIYNLTKNIFGKWRAKRLKDIDDSPMCFTFVNENTMYLLTSKKLMKVIDNDVKEVIIDDGFWIHPNSIAFDDGYIYIGMRAGVGKINISNKKVDFFIPSE